MRRALPLIYLMAAACGDDGTQCGPGTELMDGECVPTVACGPGTVDDGAGNCVPDGTVVCADGTMFDTASGTCVPSMDVCGDGTVLIDGVCRDPATVVPDATEAAEVNETAPGGAGTVTVPGIGAPGFVIHGCITPRDSGATADLDPWIVTVTQPTVLEVSADGLGGLAAGFAVFNGDDNPALENYQRFGINTLTDSAKRQLYLPLAGTYALIMADQRTILGLGAAGNDASCYYATIKQVAMPGPTTLTLPTTMGTDSGNVQVYRFTSTADGTIFKATVSSSSTVVTPAWVALRASSFHGLGTDQGERSFAPARYIGAIDNTQTVDVIVDMEINTAIAPQPFRIDSYSITASALPTTGGTVTVTKQNGVNPRDGVVDPTGVALIRNINYYYFDVASTSDVVHFNTTANQPAAFFVLRTDIIDNDLGEFDGLAALGQSANLTFQDQFIRFLTPGRYYVGVFQTNGVANQTYSLTSTLTPQTAAAVNVGDTLTAQPISAVTGSAWREFDPGMAKWVQMTGAGANLGGNLEVLYYPGFIEGWLDNQTANPVGNIGTVPEFDQSFAANGTTPAQGRVALNFPLEPFLVRFRSDASPAANQTFDFAIANRTFTDLMAVTEATAISMANVMVPANSNVRFLVESVGRVNIATTGANFNAAITWLRFDEAPIFTQNANTAVGDETLPGVPAFFGYVAFQLENLTGTAGTATLNVTTRTPAPFVEICPNLGGNGAAILVGDDEITGNQTLPFTFPFFGANQTQYRVSTNGFLAFGTALADSTPFPPATGIPTATGPNSVVAAYWYDLETTVCRRNDANRTIIEWAGFSYSQFQTVHVQVSIYNTNSRIEWAFGPAHAANGSGALGGVEDAAGTAGTELFQGASVGLLRPGYGDVVLVP